METTQQRWELDVIFPGGSTSPQFKEFLSQLGADIAKFTNEFQAQSETVDIDMWVAMIETVQNLADRQREAGAFISCLEAADMGDRHAKSLRGRISQLGAELGSMFTAFDAALKNLREETWNRLLCDPRLAPIRFGLEERKIRVVERLEPAQEQLISDLMVDGYHGWGQLYNTIVGRMSLPYEENGIVKPLSMGQAHNKLSSPDKSVRDQVFSKWEETWASESEVFGDTLNHLAGFRLQVYKHRGWDSVEREPLELNRMDAQTLHTMWNVIERNKHFFVDYLKAKAKLQGQSELGWQDVDAPVGTTAKTMTYAQARSFIVEQFRHFSPDLASFADFCFEERWIESEDRPGKRPGGFCTSFPVSGQTRVFTTFSGTMGNVATLAHELGHAYHQHVMRGLPRFAQNYAMNVAETASTFAEMVVADAALDAAKTSDERIVMLDDKLRRSVAMFMNIHSRFLFETRFYDERQRGVVSVLRLNALMEEAQREAFQGSLASYHPLFWASKLHFYITGTPFYNFPYTFGYLFSTGIYTKAKQAGAGFADKYVALLRDTASMRVEDLASKHLNVDLRDESFWQDAIDTLLPDVHEFIQLAE